MYCYLQLIPPRYFLIFSHFHDVRRTSPYFLSLLPKVVKLYIYITACILVAFLYIEVILNPLQPPLSSKGSYVGESFSAFCLWIYTDFTLFKVRRGSTYRTKGTQPAGYCVNSPMAVVSAASILVLFPGTDHPESLVSTNSMQEMCSTLYQYGVLHSKNNSWKNNHNLCLPLTMTLSFLRTQKTACPATHPSTPCPQLRRFQDSLLVLLK